MLALQGVSKKFGASLAVNDACLHLEPGEKCCLVGPTGSGKTTLLRLIAGFERPEQGEILINGKLVSSPQVLVPPHQRKIGMVFQNLAIWPHLSILKHLLLAMNSKMPRRQKVVRALNILDKIGLGELSGKYPGMLSGGQKQKLAIARMMAGQPQLALCDEPFAHLDPVSKEEVKDNVYRWVERNKITFIVVTHDPLEDFSYFDKIMLMQHGSLVPIDQPLAETAFLKSMRLLTGVS